MDRKLILASGSPRRREILENLGISFEVVKSECDEVTGAAAPEEVVTSLSLRKARDVKSRVGKDAMILAADTVVALDGRILGKPADVSEAFEMLSSLSGRTHEVYTGVALLLPDGREISFYECTKVEVADLDRAETEAYIASGEPMDKAGAYGIQGLFSVHIKGITGDYFNVVGLPVARLYAECKKEGVVLV
ncbi:MAG: septum formation protein Maf [Lachnospiraceae bacterium]|nr:septum formation protein Maf [Lachnospiraceae bacterium]